MSRFNERGDSQSNFDHSKENFEPEHEEIIKDIFAACDDRNCGFVAVSQIISFISPYVNYDEERLKELQQTMDPQGLDPLITERVLIKAMDEWTMKPSNLLKSPSNEGVDHLDLTKENNHSEIDLMQRSDLNLSNISNYSCSGSTNGVLDINLLQEEIAELQHHNKKLNDKLNDVSNQLVATEEQNTYLQSEVERLDKKLQHEIKSNEMYLRERKEYEEYRVNVDATLKKYETVNQAFLTLKKENKQLKSYKETLEMQNLELEETISQLKKIESVGMPKVEKLQKDLSMKNKEIFSLQSRNKDLEFKTQSLQIELQEQKEKIQCLEQEKKNLEQKLSTVLNTSDPNSPISLAKEVERKNSEDEDTLYVTIKDSENTQRASDINSLQAEMLQASVFNTGLESLNTGLKMCCEDKLKLIQYDHKIKRLEQTIKEYDKYRKEGEENKKQIAELLDRIKEIDSDRDRIKKELQTLTRKNSKLEQLLYRSKITLKELEELKTKHFDEISQLKNREQKLVEENKRQKQTENEFAESFSKNIEKLKTDALKLKEEKETALNELTKVKKDNLNLNDSILSANNRIKQLISEIDNAQVEIQEKDKKLAKINKLYVSIKDEYEAIQSSISKKEKFFHDANKNLEETQRKLLQAEKLLDEKIAMNDTSTSELMKLTDLINKYEKDVRKLQATNQDLTSDVAKLKSEITENISKLQEKDKIISKLNKDLSNLKTKSDEAQKELTTTNDKLKTENEKLHSKINKIERDLKDKQKVNDELNKEIGTFKKNLDEREKEICNVGKLRDEIGKLQAKLIKFEREIKEKNKINDDINKEIIKYKNEVETKMKHLCEKNEQNITLKKALEKFKMQLDEKDSINEKISKDYEKLTSKFNEKNSELNDLKKEKLDLQSENLELKKEVTEHFNKIEDLQTKLSERNQAIEKIKSNVDDINQRITETEEELAQTRKILLQKETELQEKSESFYTLNNEVSNLKTDLSNKEELLLQRKRSYENLSQELDLIRSEMIHIKTSYSTENLERVVEKPRKSDRISRRDILQHKIDKLDEQLSDEKLRTKSVEQKLQDILSQKIILEIQLQELNQKYSTAIAEKENFTESNKKLQSKIETLESKLMNKVQTITKLNEKIDESKLNYHDVLTKLKTLEHDYSRNKKKLSEYIVGFSQEIIRHKKDLESVTVNAATAWKDILQKYKNPENPKLTTPKIPIPLEESHDSRNLVDHMSRFNDQVHRTKTLLEVLAKIQKDLRDNKVLKSPGSPQRSPRKHFILRRPVLMLSSNCENLNCGNQSNDTSLEVDKLSKELAELELNNNDISTPKIKNVTCGYVIDANKNIDIRPSSPHDPTKSPRKSILKSVTGTEVSSSPHLVSFKTTQEYSEKEITFDLGQSVIYPAEDQGLSELTLGDCSLSIEKNSDDTQNEISATTPNTILKEYYKSSNKMYSMGESMSYSNPENIYRNVQQVGFSTEERTVTTTDCTSCDRNQQKIIETSQVIARVGKISPRIVEIKDSPPQKDKLDGFKNDIENKPNGDIDAEQDGITNGLVKEKINAFETNSDDVQRGPFRSHWPALRWGCQSTNKSTDGNSTKADESTNVPNEFHRNGFTTWAGRGKATYQVNAKLKANKWFINRGIASKSERVEKCEIRRSDESKE